MQNPEDLQTLFDRLRHICEAMEDKKTSLEKAVELYQEGEALRQKIKSLLDSAERNIVEVIHPDGRIETIAPAEYQQKR